MGRWRQGKRWKNDIHINPHSVLPIATALDDQQAAKLISAHNAERDRPTVGRGDRVMTKFERAWWVFWATLKSDLLFWKRRNEAKRGKKKSAGHVKHRSYK